VARENRLRANGAEAAAVGTVGGKTAIQYIEALRKE
jgi:hypothetical protein